MTFKHTCTHVYTSFPDCQKQIGSGPDLCMIYVAKRLCHVHWERHTDGEHKKKGKGVGFWEWRKHRERLVLVDRKSERRHCRQDESLTKHQPPTGVANLLPSQWTDWRKDMQRDRPADRTRQSGDPQLFLKCCLWYIIEYAALQRIAELSSHVSAQVCIASPF